LAGIGEVLHCKSFEVSVMLIIVKLVDQIYDFIMIIKQNNVK